MRECDRVIYDRPIPPRLLRDLEAVGEVHETEPAYLEGEGPHEAERVPVEHRPMGVREAEAPRVSLMGMSYDVVGRWEAPRGLRWIELLRRAGGNWSYRGETCSGVLGAMTRSEAESRIEKRIDAGLHDAYGKRAVRVFTLIEIEARRGS